MKISMISIDVSVDIDVTATAAAQFDWMDACAIHTTIEEEKADLGQLSPRRKKKKKNENEEPHRFSGIW